MGSIEAGRERVGRRGGPVPLAKWRKYHAKGRWTVKPGRRRQLSRSHVFQHVLSQICATEHRCRVFEFEADAGGNTHSKFWGVEVARPAARNRRWASYAVSRFVPSLPANLETPILLQSGGTSLHFRSELLSWCARSQQTLLAGSGVAQPRAPRSGRCSKIKPNIKQLKLSLISSTWESLCGGLGGPPRDHLVVENRCQGLNSLVDPLVLSRADLLRNFS